MKKRLFAMVIIAVMIMSATGCGGGSNVGASDDSATTTVTYQTTAADDADVEEITSTTGERGIEEEVIEPPVDYSDAKRKIDAFYDTNDATYNRSVILKDNTDASWICLDSYVDHQSGGSYENGWTIYVLNVDTKCYIDFEVYPTNAKEEGMPIYDGGGRVGDGTFKIYAIYQNDEKSVYFYLEDEVIIDDTTVVESNRIKEYHFNLTEFIGEDITLFTYQLEN